MKVFEFIIPTEKNGYNLFSNDLEKNPFVLFHVTPYKNMDSIINNGFKFGKSLQSTSYAYNSSSCLSHRGQNVTEDCLIFVVKFSSLEEKSITKNISDIHVYCENNQPEIIGYCVIPKDYVFK